MMGSSLRTRARISSYLRDRKLGLNQTKSLKKHGGVVVALPSILLAILLAGHLLIPTKQTRRPGHNVSESILASSKVGNAGSSGNQYEEDYHSQACQLLPSGGHLSIVWAFHESPSSTALQFTLEHIGQHYPSMTTKVYCGSDSCMHRALASKYPCVFVEHIIIPKLTADTPLQLWATENILTKLLAVHHFESQLQIALQLVTLWKYGGIVFSPGTGPSDVMPPGPWIAFSSSMNESGEHSPCMKVERDSMIIPKTADSIDSAGFYAMAGDAHSRFLGDVLARMVAEYEKPYSPADWPLQIDFGKLAHESLTEMSCCSPQAPSGVCPEVHELDDLNLGKIDVDEIRSNRSRHHYGTLAFNARRSYLRSVGNMGMNVGDEMQGLAGIQFLPYIDSFVERDRLDVVRFTTMGDYSNSEVVPMSGGEFETPSEITTLFLNGWYASPTWVWPPGPNIDPILVAIHLQPSSRDLVQQEKRYLLERSPIGARDLPTLTFMKENKVPALFSGCMTLTLSRLFKPDKFVPSEILIVDVTKSALKRALPEEIRAKSVLYSHKMLNQTSSRDRLARFVEAFQAMKKYSRAKLVITQRLHVALPSAAMGTPVILLKDESLPGGGGKTGLERLSGLSEVVHTFDASEFADLKESKLFNWDKPPQNPNESKRLNIRNRLRVFAYCNDNIRDSARKFGMIPGSWESPGHGGQVCSARGEKSEGIYVATALDMNWFATFPTWLNAIAKTNSGVRLNLLVLTYNTTPLAECLLSWLGDRLLKNGRMYVVSGDEALKRISYSPSKNHLGRITITTQLRLFVGSLFPCLDKLLWIDLDALVLLPLTELWETKVESGCGIVARSSLRGGVVRRMSSGLPIRIFRRARDNFKGFNAGVMVLDLNVLRRQRFEEEIVSYFAGVFGANDQVTLNMACNGTHGEMAGKWNIFYSEGGNDPMREVDVDEWGIFHFTGHGKPMAIGEERVAKRTQVEFRLWEKYYMRWEDALTLT